MATILTSIFLLVSLWFCTWSVGVCELVARGVNVLHARVLVRLRASV